jgi:hypothetical protein
VDKLPLPESVPGRSVRAILLAVVEYAQGARRRPPELAGLFGAGPVRAPRKSGRKK